MKEFEQEQIDLIESGLGKAYILSEKEVDLFDRLEREFKLIIASQLEVVSSDKE